MVLSGSLVLKRFVTAWSEPRPGLEVLCPSFCVWRTQGDPDSQSVGQGSGPVPASLAAGSTRGVAKIVYAALCSRTRGDDVGFDVGPAVTDLSNSSFMSLA